jgi:hypothetical protein
MNALVRPPLKLMQVGSSISNGLDMVVLRKMMFEQVG